MNTTEDRDVVSLLKNQVMEVGSLASAGQYSRAMSTVRNAKAIYPKNIFIIALEKQLEKLLVLTYNPALSDLDRQKEILASIPTLAQRAVEVMNSEGTLPTSPPPSHSKDRDAAFKKLKDQYFHLADGHMQRSEYQSALEEIRRVLILDPDEAMAKEYQRKIKEFIDLKEKPAPATTSPTLHEKRPEPTPQPPLPVSKVPPKTKQPVREESRKHVTEEKTQQRVNRMSPLSRTLLAVGIPVLVVALAVTYLSLREESTDPAPAMNSSVVNKPVASESTEPTVAKTEPEQIAPRILPDSQASPTVNDLNLPKQVPPDEKPAAASGIIASRERSLPVTDVTATSTKPSQVGLGAKPPIEPSNANVEVQPPAKTKPNDVELPKRDEPKASDPKTPALTKVDVVSATPIATPRADASAQFTDVERKPEIIRLTSPKFPTVAWNAGIEGEVMVKVQVGSDGKPIQAKIVKSSSDLFNDAVIEAVLSSQYSPGMMGTGPVTTWLQIPFTFKRRGN